MIGCPDCAENAALVYDMQMVVLGLRHELVGVTAAADLLLSARRQPSAAAARASIDPPCHEECRHNADLVVELQAQLRQACAHGVR